MATMASWLGENWFSLFQTFGIIGGLIFTSATIREDHKTRQFANILALAERHRELWKEAVDRPDLSRVFDPKANLSVGATMPEEEFLNLVFIHFELGWRLARSIGADEVRAQWHDIRKFFSLPLPFSVWEHTKSSRNQGFVRFVESALELPLKAV